LCPLFRGKSSSVPEGEGFGEGLGVGLEPLESSSAWKKWRKIERDQKIIAQEVSKRLRTNEEPDLYDSISSILDDELEP
jgi:hypothetical protein